MPLPISGELLERLSLTGKSAALALWQRKTNNLFRGVFEIDCTDQSPDEIAAQVLKTVKVEYEPGLIVPFAFGVVLQFASGAPTPSQMESLVDDRARNRGTWQWLVVIDQASRQAFGVHMWAKGYLTPVFEAILEHLQSQGYATTQHIKQPGKFWVNLWALAGSLLTARKVLAALGAVMALLLVVYQVVTS